MRRINKTYLVFLFFLGLGLGVFFVLQRANASNPGSEASGGETTASVYYDETWKATETIVSSDAGLKVFYPYSDDNPGGTPSVYPAYPLPAIPNHHNTDIAAAIITGGISHAYVSIFPKMVVTKWRVHGHIHFK
ncbi:MAG: hypothetical protein WC510_04330 [Candidatus Omnitrophota bacterium]